MIIPLNPSFVRNSLKRILTLGKHQMLPLACIYHATIIDRGVAATNLRKTASTAQKKASEDTMIYRKDNFKV